jgi:hypothetical protein
VVSWAESTRPCFSDLRSSDISLSLEPFSDSYVNYFVAHRSPCFALERERWAIHRTPREGPDATFACGAILEVVVASLCVYTLSVNKHDVLNLGVNGLE